MERIRLLQGETTELFKVVAAFEELSRPIHLRLETASLGRLLRATVEEERTRAEADASVEVLCELDSLADAEGLADGEKLAEAIGEVLRNSVESMPEEGGTVTVYAERLMDDRVLVEVYDTGEGFSDFALDRCFDAFFSTKAGRLGLGLTKARRILEAHGGDIELTAPTKAP
ncbi:ATP-binding protein [Planctomycetota bacterium]